MDWASFRAAVEHDLHESASTDEAALLRDPANLDRWRTELVQALRKVDHQLTAAKSEIVRKTHDLRPRDPKRFQDYLEYRADWRARTMRFRSKIEERLAENRALRQHRADVPAALKTLIEAIERHRDLASQTKDVDVSVDENLWSVLEDREVRSAARMAGAA